MLSSQRFRNENSNKVRQFLNNNSYPARLIECLIRKEKQENYSKSVDVDVGSEIVFYCALPYLHNVTDKVSKLVTAEVKNMKIANACCNSLKHTLLQPVPKDDKIKMLCMKFRVRVPMIRCMMYELSYVGQTKNRLKTRMKQHSNDVKNAQKNQSKTALVHHFVQTGHEPDFDRARVVTTESNYHKSLTLISKYSKKQSI